MTGGDDFRPSSDALNAIAASGTSTDLHDRFARPPGRGESCVRRFAALGAAKLANRSLIGRSIWEFVGDPLPRQLWQVLYARVRAIGAPLFVPMRADDANHRRVVDLELYPAGDRSIRHVRECVVLEERASVSLLDVNYPRDSRVLNRCAWCARVKVGLGDWQEIEDAHQALGLGDAVTLPVLRDVACEPCKQSVLKSFPLRVA